MLTNALAPYLQLASEQVTWKVALADKTLSQEISVEIPEWHPGLSCPLSVDIDLELTAALQSLNLDPEYAGLGFFVTAYSATTGYKWVSEPTPISADFTQSHFQLPKHSFGGLLRIECSIYVMRTSASPKELSPPKNALIERQRYFAALEGDLARPSIVICEFNSARNRDALWEFETDFPTELQDWLTADLSTVIAIKLNAPLYEKHGTEESYVRSLGADYISVLVEGALRNRDIGKYIIEENPKHSTGTLWTTTKSALSSIFAGDDGMFVYQEFSNRRDFVNSVIQSVSNRVIGSSK
ncbi:MAG: hypothetical protein RLZZ330_1120 [Actinomycetota bacterium]|jgi:hypothetical protein